MLLIFFDRKTLILPPYLFGNSHNVKCNPSNFDICKKELKL